VEEPLQVGLHVQRLHAVKGSDKGIERRKRDDDEDDTMRCAGQGQKEGLGKGQSHLPLVLVRLVAIVPRAVRDHHHPRGASAVHARQVCQEEIVLERARGEREGGRREKGGTTREC
jgi:hypothetical protein